MRRDVNVLIFLDVRKALEGNCFDLSYSSQVSLKYYENSNKTESIEVYVGNQTYVV